MTIKPILGPCDSYQLAPFAYKWAWDMYQDCRANEWTPKEIGVDKDVVDWKSPELPESHRHLFLSVMAQLTTFDIERGDDAAETFLSIIQPAEMKQFLKRLIFEEAGHCYEEGTEVLTAEGWKDFRSVSDDDLIAQVDFDGKISFTRHLGVVRDPFDGDLVEFKNKAMHSVVTPNHRCVTISRAPNAKDRGKWKIERANTMSMNNRLWPVAALSTKVLSGFSYSSFTAMDQLRVAYQADGFARSANRVSFRFKKQRKIDRLCEILNRTGLEYDKLVKECDPEVTEIRIRTPLKLEKLFNNWVELPRVTLDWAKSFMEELVHWDGTTHHDTGTMSYSTMHQENVDMVQAIGVFAGYHVRSHDYECEAGKRVTLVPKGTVTSETIQRTMKPYKGMVYSVAVPSTVIVVRYNGFVLVSGNTESYRYCIENMGIPEYGPDNIYDTWKRVPVFEERIKLSQSISDPLLEWNHKKIELADYTLEDKEAFLRAAIYWFLIFEGVWFWISLLGPVQHLSRLGYFRKTAEQFSYIIRDEAQHIKFGINLIREFMVQYPEAVNENSLNQVKNDIDKALILEDRYIQYCLKEGSVMGYSAGDHSETARYLANMRLRSIGLPNQFENVTHKFPWFSEALELKKEKNFFESRVTEYRTGGALDFSDAEDNFNIDSIL